ncbi:MAG: hypothetical protein IJ573_03850 [Clostridia bacterium]|nr:hypothetical protein [Clostridia bacterium]
MMKRLFCILLTISLLFAIGAAAESDDVIRVSSRSEPQSVISEQDVSVTIKVYNTGSEDVEGSITLFNSDGQSVEKYNGLKAGQTVTYTGPWHVTSDQISKGKISYYIRYPAKEEGAEPLLRTIPITIQTEAPAPQLTVTYTVSPTSARTGQQITATYTLSNTGNIELRNIAIDNAAFSEKKLTAASLSVGERIVLTDTVAMGEENLICEPQVTYRSADSDKELTVEDLGRRTVALTQNGLSAELASDDAENVYPGADIGLTLKLKNTGETALQNITAALDDGTTLLSLAELAAGGSYESKADYAPAGDGTLSATVTGSTPGGETVTVQTNEITVAMQDASTALILEVNAAAENETIYSEPAVVRFGVEVKNTGETDAATLTVTESGKTVGTISSLPSGEARSLVFDAELSMAGQVQFAVSGKDALGNERTYRSNIIEMVYVAPTPAPTAAPTPTPVPPTPSPVPTATPAPTLMEQISEHVDPMILAIAGGVLLALILLAVILRAVRSAKQQKRMKDAVDTMTMETDVRDSFGHRKGRRRTAKPSKQERSQIVSTTELTEEDTKAPAAQETKEEAEDSRRRRPAHETAEVSDAKTLRVSPADERPEYVENPKVTDSQTKVFSRVTPPDGPAKEGETIRLDRAAIARSVSEAEKEAAAAEPEAPQKKRGLFSRLGKRDQQAEQTADDDDLYE